MSYIFYFCLFLNFILLKIACFIIFFEIIVAKKVISHYFCSAVSKSYLYLSHIIFEQHLKNKLQQNFLITNLSFNKSIGELI